MDTDTKQLKRRIRNAIKDLERTDYNDICMLIKVNTNSYPMIDENRKGTFINLDEIDLELLKQLDHMINTKLQRISGRT